jgi:hypothetical protein
VTPEKSGGTNFQSRWNHLPCVCAFEKSGGTGFEFLSAPIHVAPLSGRQSCPSHGRYSVITSIAHNLKGKCPIAGAE